MSTAVEKMDKPGYIKVADETGFRPGQVAVLHNTVAKGTNTDEFMYFLYTCRSMGLNPMHKEIWCYRDNRGNLIVIAGRDGFLKKAQESELWNGMTSAWVCEKDEFWIDSPNGKIHHVYKPTEHRGEIIGAYAMVKPKNVEFPTVFWADRGTYDKGYAVWKSHPGAMLMKVAETQVLKKAFGISGLQSEHDFEIINDVAIPVSANSPKNDLMQKLEDAINLYQGEDKMQLQKMIAEKIQAGEADDNFLTQMLSHVGVEEEE